MKIINYVFLVIILTIWASCNQAGNKYHGYVYDKDKPLANVRVIEDWYNPARFTETDSNGYFKLERRNVIGNLIFIKEGYTIDTVVPFRIHAGENISYTFLNKEPDTIRLIRISKKLK